jgi:NAD(P)-dependent dehydrogenase (short-subunit alcohol dehydrogenase family)
MVASLFASPVPDRGDLGSPGAGRSALVTGGSRGIGYALAEMLGSEGYSLTVVSRRSEALASAEARLRDCGFEVQSVVVDVQLEGQIAKAVSAHRDAYGRLDVLVNNAGCGVVAPIEDLTTAWIDRILAVNLRATILFYRESLDMLSQAGEEHGNALVVNLASVVGKTGHESLSVYSAAKHGVVGFTQAMNQELWPRGIKSCALCPGYVDTDLADFMKDEIPGNEMIQTHDVAEMVRALLRLSRWCVVPEIVMTRPGDAVVA